jgi:hypothetical protein
MMTTEPLTPEQVDRLLRPDPRTRAADLLVLRDSLLRMGSALERLANAMSHLQRASGELSRAAKRWDAEIPRKRGTPPRAD